MKLFYVYLKNNGVQHGRCLMTFASREAADEWWRMISTSHTPYATSIERISPQFYVQNDSNNDVCKSFSNTNLPNARQFLRNMFLSTVSGGFYGETPAIIPPSEVTDHISGRWYFLRSNTDPFSHWYLRINGMCLVCGDADCNVVHVSSEYRTRFCIRVQNTADDFQVPENFVMIGRDEISITARKDYVLHISDEGDLKATKGHRGGMDLFFSDFKNRFITRTEKQVNGEVWEYVESVERGVGEVWELVE